MRKFVTIWSLVFSMAFVFFAFTDLAKAAGPTEVWEDINASTVWALDGSPYIVRKRINVNASLRIEAGVVVKFDTVSNNPVHPSLIVKSDLVAIGNSNAKIFLTSLRDDSIGGDTNGNGNLTIPHRGDWAGIFLTDDPGNISMESVVIAYADYGLHYQNLSAGNYHGLSLKYSEIHDCNRGLYLRDVEPILENNAIRNNYTGIKVYFPINKDRHISIKNSAIYDNDYGVDGSGYYVGGMSYFDARDNWWGDSSGPYVGAWNSNGKGDWIISNWTNFTPWLLGKPPIEPPRCEQNCFSNVLFLPGLKGSHLYKTEAGGMEDELWIPNYFGNDVEELALDENGNSINNVYTRDVIEAAGLPVIGNIYKTFIEKLATLKSSGTISDYGLFAYDWRQNVEEVVDGTPYPGGAVKSVAEEFRKLAESSKSGKVTIVAHSNGGLLAKALARELERTGQIGKLDKMVLVASPQMGTPLAALSLLYGYDEGVMFGTLISRAEAREFGENMPGAYGLLPSEEYLSRTEDPLITFSSERTRYKDFQAAYDDSIDSFDEFKSFLTGGGDGREKPDRGDVERENVLRENILNQAIETHSRLDAWTPPEGVEVIEIAGWGIDTVSGIDYTEKEKIKCYPVTPKMPSCVGIGEYEPVYDPKFTVDGDKTVVASSALMLPEAGNVKRYWVDLYRSNKIFTDGKAHSDILEFSPLQDFIQSIINNQEESISLPSYVYTSRPDDYNNASSRLRMSLYSPLDIHLYDDEGRHTGLKNITVEGEERTIFEEGIPNSYYYQFGERKYVGFGVGEHIRVKMDGYNDGAYTLKLEEVKVAEEGDEVVSHVTFANLPVAPETTVSFDVPENGLAEMTSLEADFDGDGTRDYKVDKVLNGTAFLDSTPPEIKIISPEEKEYLNNQVLSFDYSVADDFSLSENITKEILYDRKPLTEDETDLSLQGLGGHYLLITATDEAGNYSENRAEFSLVTNVEILSKNVDHYLDLGLIT
ncbi:hypothetical protein EPO05_04435, partial [Patescibacteria group bacterium]